MPQEQRTHAAHNHAHGTGCGHKAIQHEGHLDYLHDGHLHHVEGDRVEEHSISVNDANPDKCTPKHTCETHAGGHKHGPGCGHEAVPHGGHTDYIVGDHLHHQHGDHCDDHGKVSMKA